MTNAPAYSPNTIKAVSSFYALGDSERRDFYWALQNPVKSGLNGNGKNGASHAEDAAGDHATKTRWTIGELYSTPFPEPRWAAPGLVPVGLSILAGRPKLGKSWLALQLAHAVCAGGKFLGADVPQGKVLYIALEDSPRRLRDRAKLQGIQNSAGIDFETAWGDLTKDGLANLQIEMERGYSLIILDTLSRALGSADQLDVAEMTGIVGSLQRMAQAGNVALLVIDHQRKPAGMLSNPVDDLLGSTGKSATADAVLGLYKEPGKPGATLKITGRDLEEKELALNWDGEFYCWQFAGEAGEVRADSFNATILQAIVELQAIGDAPTTARIATHIGKHKANVSRALAGLVGDGKVKRGEKAGREQPYTLP